MIDGEGIIRFSQVYPDLLNPGVDDILTTLEAMAADEESTGKHSVSHTGLEPIQARQNKPYESTNG